MCGRLRIGKEKLHALVGGLRAFFARCFRTHAAPLIAASAPAPVTARVSASAQLRPAAISARSASLAAIVKLWSARHYGATSAGEPRPPSTPRTP
jgi:hypothetical protein